MTESLQKDLNTSSEGFQFPTLSVFSCSWLLSCSLSAVREEISSSDSENP